MKNGILEEMPNEFDRRYYPTTQDLRNITKGVINKIRKNTFDQDALEILLHDEVKETTSFNISFENTKILKITKLKRKN